MGHDGPSGLTPEARAQIAQAEVLAGGKRHLAFFPDWTGETIVIGAQPDRAVQQLKAIYAQKKTVVLASGDPLFYGIGRLLAEQLPVDALYFLPHVSSVQLAFARLRTSWHDAHIVSLHGRPMRALLPALHQCADKVALFTDGPDDRCRGRPYRGARPTNVGLQLGRSAICQLAPDCSGERPSAPVAGRGRDRCGHL
jgi:precorrin-6Y C5,15-methyltransferase (decarboxylating)